MPIYAYDHNPLNIHNLLSELIPHNISHTLDLATRNSKSNTPWSPAPPQHTPLIVFFPQTTQETSLILKACNDRRIAVTPFSGGTSFGSALAATKGGICVSLERMNKILAVHEDDMDAVVQPGLGWVDLNEKLADKGLFFPVDPAPGAKIGGMVCTIPIQSMWAGGMLMRIKR
jgi:D-lactate dehydrogenase (cytochrome)